MPVYFNSNAKKYPYYVKCSYLDDTGKRRQKMKRGFLRKRDAREWEHSFLSMQPKPNSAVLPFSTLLQLYQADLQGRIKLSTSLKQASIIRTHISPYFNKQSVFSIRAVDIRRWQAQLMQQKTRRGDCYAPTYLHTIQITLSSIFEYAVRYHQLPVNPCKAAGRLGAKRAGRMHFWTKPEFDCFLSTFSAADPFRTAFLLLYYTGIRIGELMALSLDDLDLDACCLSINKTYHLISRTPVITSPKTKKSIRSVLLPNFLAAHLSRYVEAQQELIDEADGRLFSMARSTYNYRIHRHAVRAGLSPIRVHDLRHSHCALLIELNFSPILIAERLGHESTETTLSVYAHLYPNKQREIAEKLEQFSSQLSPERGTPHA